MMAENALAKLGTPGVLDVRSASGPRDSR
jgi:hypothetical protein